MQRRKNKKHILQVLGKEQWPEIKTILGRYDDQELVHHLFTALCSTDQKCKWHGVRAFGLVLKRIAGRDLEAARIIMRRFLWSLNDESGGIGWGVPEAMGEVMARHDTLFDEYSHMLISYMRPDGPELFQDGNFLELPALQQGLLWGIGRLLSARPAAMLDKGVENDLLTYLDSPDNTVRGLAVWCLGMCNPAKHAFLFKKLSDDHHGFQLYRQGELQEVTIAMLAGEALARIAAESVSC